MRIGRTQKAIPPRQSVPSRFFLHVRLANTKRERQARLEAGGKFAQGKVVKAEDTTALLEAVIHPGDRVCLEGDKQKQADHIAECLANADTARLLLS